MYTHPRMTNLAGAAVALVILVDLATGQGPPVYNNYMQAQGYRGPPAPPSMPMPPSGGLYPQRVEYSSAPDKELEKAIELGKVEDAPAKESLAHAHAHEKKFEKEKPAKERGADYTGKEDYQSTPAPGMLSSLSNSMSDAWGRLSSLGRSIRSVSGDEKEAKPSKSSAARNDTRSASAGKPTVPASSGRGIDSYEYLQRRQNGYIYFKVPKHLVCNY